MAELDPNIILGIKPVQIDNPLDAASRAMTFKTLMGKSQMQDLENQKAMRDANDQTAMRSALSNNVKINDDGTYGGVDSAGVIKNLASTGNSHLIPQFSADQAAKQAAMQENQIKAKQAQWGAMGQILGTVSDQDSYDKAIPQLKALGVNTDQLLPAAYDPKHVAQLQMGAMSAHDQLDAQNKQQETANKKAQLEIDSKKLGMEQFKTYGNPVTSGSGQGGAPKIDPNVDPATLVRTHVPPERQAKVYDEIGAAQATAQNAPKILQAYDNAVAKIKAGTYTPEQINPDIGAMQTNLGPTFKDVEGTVRQAAMDNLYGHIVPGNLDGKIVNKQGQDGFTVKRQALVNYLTSKSAAPTAKGAGGIDLSQYNSTRIDPKVLVDPNAPKKKTIADHPQDSAAVAWAKANPNDKRSAQILKLNGITETADK